MEKHEKLRRSIMIIKLENICKTYESKGIRVTALRNINLEIGKGEFSL